MKGVSVKPESSYSFKSIKIKDLNLRELTNLTFKQFKQLEERTKALIENDRDLCIKYEREKEKSDIFEKELQKNHQYNK